MGVAIKQAFPDTPVSTIFKLLFSNEIESVDIPASFDSRKDENVHIVKYKDFIVVFNGKLCNTFFEMKFSDFEKDLYYKLGKPAIMIGFQDLSSADAYGFSVIKSGDQKRVVWEYEPDGITKVFGEKIEEEQDWEVNENYVEYPEDVPDVYKLNQLLTYDRFNNGDFESDRLGTIARQLTYEMMMKHFHYHWDMPIEEMPEIIEEGRFVLKF